MNSSADVTKEGVKIIQDRADKARQDSAFKDWQDSSEAYRNDATKLRDILMIAKLEYGSRQRLTQNTFNAMDRILKETDHLTHTDE